MEFVVKESAYLLNFTLDLWDVAKDSCEFEPKMSNLLPSCSPVQMLKITILFTDAVLHTSYETWTQTDYSESLPLKWSLS